MAVTHDSNASYEGGRDQKDRVQSQPGQIVLQALFQKNPSQKKRAGGVTHGAEHLPSKCEALSSNPSTKKKKAVCQRFGPGSMVIQGGGEVFKVGA
jgi:hypothetical protein